MTLILVRDLTTAYSTEDYLLKSIDLDINGYIVKPIDLYKMLNKFQTIAKKINKKKRTYRK
jgi:YesN/AraC family two-component response regulator